MTDRDLPLPRSVSVALVILAAGVTLATGRAWAATVSGAVREAASPHGPVPNARMTLFTPDLVFFRETRTDAAGSYVFGAVPAGSYRLGSAALRHGYQDVTATVAPSGLVRDFSLSSETEPGQWVIIGSTGDEFFDATDIGILLPNGWIFYCHDTTDPVVFDPRTGDTLRAAASGLPQGCMNGSLLEDGSVIIAGGQDGDDPGSFIYGIPWVKRYDWAFDVWERLADLRHSRGRWYPGMARLADGTFLVMGGGQSPDASRTRTCERYEPISRTWAYTDSMENPCEFPPSALLYTGDVLATWWPPQLYNPVTGTWRLTGNFNQPNRGWPGHSDHSIVVLDDGRVLAIGILRGPDGNSVMGEIYNPATESWSLTSNPGLRRFQCEVVQLPDGRVFVAGGETEATPPPVPTVLGIVKWCDIYDPTTNSWRRVDDMNWFREYHAVTHLLPDGRVSTTGGTRIKFSYGPTTTDVEAYSPPYLFRGIRPEITSISSTELGRGTGVSLSITPATTLTSIVLMGLESTTHWVSGGIPRRLVLPVSQAGSTATATLPADPNVVPLGYYMLYAMVDDIPSEAVIVKVKAATATDVAVSPIERNGARSFTIAPNPSHGSAAIRFDLAYESRVRVQLHDVNGRLVRNLVEGAVFAAGPHALEWDGRDRTGRQAGAGIYYCRLESSRGTETRRLVYLP